MRRLWLVFVGLSERVQRLGWRFVRRLLGWLLDFGPVGLPMQRLSGRPLAYEIVTDENVALAAGRSLDAIDSDNAQAVQGRPGGRLASQRRGIETALLLIRI
jgi:hypothetical protein